MLSQPLTWDGHGARRSAPSGPRRCRWTQDRHAFVQGLRPGDLVALHWDWVCDRLDPQQVAELAGRTARQLDAVNRWLSLPSRLEVGAHP